MKKIFLPFSFAASLMLLFSGCFLFSDEPAEQSDLLPAKALQTQILVMGDSLTEGYGLRRPDDAFPAQLEQMLRTKGYQVKVINAGISGETTAGGVRRTDWVLKAEPEIILVALGGNDLLRMIDPDEVKKNLRAILNDLQNSDAKLILAGMKASDASGSAYQQKFDSLYSDLAAEFEIPLVPFLLEGVALDPTLNQSDGIHPNAAGAKEMAENVLPVIEASLNEI